MGNNAKEWEDRGYRVFRCADTEGSQDSSSSAVSPFVAKRMIHPVRVVGIEERRCVPPTEPGGEWRFAFKIEPEPNPEWVAAWREHILSKPIEARLRGAEIFLSCVASDLESQVASMQLAVETTNRIVADASRLEAEKAEVMAKLKRLGF